MTYAPKHEKELLDQSYRPRMGVSQTPRPTSQQTRTTQNSHHPRDPRCGLLRPKKRLSLAVVAPRLPTLGDRIYCWFRRWRIDGTWEQLNATLRERVRTSLGRNAQPSAGIVDSQSAQDYYRGGW